MLLKQENG